jgi:hypothetical protein
MACWRETCRPGRRDILTNCRASTLNARKVLFYFIKPPHIAHARKYDRVYSMPVIR